MPDSELAVVSVDSFAAPILIERAGPSTRKRFIEFFTVPIRNANTRAAYYRAIQQFLAWADRASYQDQGPRAGRNASASAKRPNTPVRAAFPASMNWPIPSPRSRGPA